MNYDEKSTRLQLYYEEWSHVKEDLVNLPMQSQIEISQRFSQYGIEPAVINALYLADLSILLGLSNGSLAHAHFIEKFLDLLFFQEERIV